jgi:hypothetical protein
MGQELRDKNDRMEKTMLSMQKITPCLWFDDQAEEAAGFIPAFSAIQRFWIFPTTERRERRFMGKNREPS